MALCAQMVEGNVVSFACDLEAGHDGPHRAIENARSVRERAKWDQDQRIEAAGARETLAQFQGPAETTAQRYTENATPVPGVTPSPVTTPLPEGAEPGPEHERIVVFTEGADAAEFRPATTAEVKVAGIGDDYLMPGARETVRDQGYEGSSVGFAFASEVYAQAHQEDPWPGEPTKQREGDQPLPTRTEAEYVQDRIISKLEVLRDEGVMEGAVADALIAQMEQSKAVGTERYGTPLQTFNGRDCLQDAIEEARDLYVYLSSMEQAREASRERLVQAAQAAMEAEWMIGAAEERVGTPAEHTTRLAEVAVDAILKATGGFDI